MWASFRKKMFEDAMIRTSLQYKNADSSNKISAHFALVNLGARQETPLASTNHRNQYDSSTKRKILIGRAILLSVGASSRVKS